LAEKRTVPADRGFRVGISEAAAVAAASGVGKSARAGDDYAERIGRSFLDKVMERAAEGVIPGGANGGAMGSVKELGEMADIIDRIRGRGQDDDGPRRRSRPKVIRVGRSNGGSNDRLLIALIENFGNTLKDVVKSNRESLEDLLDRLDRRLEEGEGGRRGKDKEPSEIEQLALLALKEKISGNDPLQTTMGIIQAGQKLREALGVQESSSDDDLDKYIARERMALERRRVDAEIEDMRETREQRGGFIAALPQIVGGKRRRTADSPPLYRYQCAVCHNKWRSEERPEPGKTITCPQCSAGLEIARVGDDDGRSAADGEEDAG
jgi:hypothetical protein